jgi:hypothetical protein
MYCIWATFPVIGSQWTRRCRVIVRHCGTCGGRFGLVPEREPFDCIHSHNRIPMHLIILFNTLSTAFCPAFFRPAQCTCTHFHRPSQLSQQSTKNQYHSRKNYTTSIQVFKNISIQSVDSNSKLERVRVHVPIRKTIGLGERGGLGKPWWTWWTCFVGTDWGNNRERQRDIKLVEQMGYFLQLSSPALPRPRPTSSPPSSPISLAPLSALFTHATLLYSLRLAYAYYPHRPSSHDSTLSSLRPSRLNL